MFHPYLLDPHQRSPGGSVDSFCICHHLMLLAPVCVCWVMSDSLWPPRTIARQSPFVYGKESIAHCLFLLQGNLPDLRIKPTRLLHGRQITAWDTKEGMRENLSFLAFQRDSCEVCSTDSKRLAVSVCPWDNTFQMDFLFYCSFPPFVSQDCLSDRLFALKSCPPISLWRNPA